MPKVTELLLGSPFDYKNNVTMYLPKKMPHPRREEEAWMAESIRYIRASLKRSHGKAFVLFTSFKACAGPPRRCDRTSSGWASRSSCRARRGGIGRAS
jgi:hypothetical protein